MKRSTDRILVYHVGSLPRPRDIFAAASGSATVEGAAMSTQRHCRTALAVDRQRRTGSVAAKSREPAPTRRPGCRQAAQAAEPARGGHGIRPVATWILAL